ncbi:DUF3108 domain-containing protein [Massilia aurea]|uniref:DUF3108 domain-containing protein n=1 Tax=Massilia aurea TaxID=373040 RepID=UPI0021620966|nr:DUF3108 domain-containing protein [Massilia aurea]MCS0709104.1 DUF3108 domain-containing protein [Massilia aurea]
MPSAPILLPRRHRLLPVVLVVLLHWIVLTELGHVSPVLPPAATPGGAPVTLVAQLLPAAPPEPAPEPVPVPEASPPPLPRVPPVPVEIAVPDRPGDITPVTDTAPSGAGAGTAPATPAAEPTPAAPAPQAPPASAPAAAPPPPPPAEPEARRYVVDMPPPAKITLDVARTDADGTEWSGEALLAWQLNADSYRIQIEAGIRVVFARVNLVVLKSEGAVAATGFAPITMTEKRRGRAMTATHFDWGKSRITFSASQASYELPAGAQDKASIPLQLAAIARGDPKQLTGAIDIFVGEDRDAVVYRFTVVGQEEIDTRLGKLQTWHLTRPPQPGSYKSRLDIWLAPAYGWYPVRIRNSEANGAVTTQTVNNIVLDHSGS